MPIICSPRLLSGFTLSALAALINPAQAQTALDTMVVVGARSETRISDTPGATWVIGQEQLQEQFRAGVPLKEALGQLIPSLDVASQGRTNYGQNMRGRSILVMIDGVSLNSSRNISRHFDSIDPFNIERVEVLSGANAIYGGGATGGIINIVTKRGQRGEAEYELEGGVRSGFEDSDDRDLHAGAAVSGGGESWAGRLSIAGSDNGGAYDSRGDQVIFDITQTDLQYNRATDLLGSLDLDLWGGQRLSLNAQLYNSGFEGDKAFTSNPTWKRYIRPTPTPSRYARALIRTWCHIPSAALSVPTTSCPSCSAKTSTCRRTTAKRAWTSTLSPTSATATSPLPNKTQHCTASRL